MILFGMTLFISQITLAQNESYSFSDVTRLTNLYSTMQSTPSRSVCYPWASTMRVVNIKSSDDGQPLGIDSECSRILSYEDLWIVLNETCLKHQRVSTQLDVTLDKKGRITQIIRNGKLMNLSQNHQLRKMKFKKLKSSKGKVIKIFTSVG